MLSVTQSFRVLANPLRNRHLLSLTWLYSFCNPEQLWDGGVIRAHRPPVRAPASSGLGFRLTALPSAVVRQWNEGAFSSVFVRRLAVRKPCFTDCVGSVAGRRLCASLRLHRDGAAPSLLMARSQLARAQSLPRATSLLAASLEMTRLCRLTAARPLRGRLRFAPQDSLTQRPAILCCARSTTRAHFSSKPPARRQTQPAVVRCRQAICF
jgi:hypothetical protein